jgi:hypothetical protein
MTAAATRVDVVDVVMVIGSVVAVNDDDGRIVARKSGDGVVCRWKKRWIESIVDVSPQSLWHAHTDRPPLAVCTKCFVWGNSMERMVRTIRSAGPLSFSAAKVDDGLKPFSTGRKTRFFQPIGTRAG